MSNIDELFEEDADALWTVDRFLGGKCINGGFGVFKPSLAIFKRMMGLVQRGAFYYGGANHAPEEGKYHGTAWEGSDVGYCYGGQTFQGIVPVGVHEIILASVHHS
jgi:hypothetical protein